MGKATNSQNRPNIKFKITPLNIACALLTGHEIVSFAFPESLKNQPYGYQHIFLIPVILVGLLIDYILQKTIRKYSWLLLVESVLIVTVILFNISV